MAIIKPNNNTLSSITALPAAISTGKVLQVVSATHGSEDNFAPASYQATELDLNITPSSSSSKILVTASIPFHVLSSGNQYTYSLFRDSTNLALTAARGFGEVRSNANNHVGNINMTILDTPSTTSQIHYEVYLFRNGGSGDIYLNYNTASTSTITAFEIGA